MLGLLRRPTSRSLRRAVCVATVATLAIIPASALAAQPVLHLHGHVSDSFSGYGCGGMPIEGTVEGTANGLLYEDGSASNYELQCQVIADALS